MGKITKQQTRQVLKTGFYNQKKSQTPTDLSGWNLGFKKLKIAEFLFDNIRSRYIEIFIYF